MKQSKFLKINGNDIKKALILGAGVLTSGELASPVIDEVATSIGDTPEHATHANSMVYAVVTMVVYLLKNWLTNSRGDIAKKDAE